MSFLSATGSVASSIQLWGIPFDGMASGRPGARFGPQAIREASQELESYSPYLQRDLDELDLGDAGDKSLSFSAPMEAQEELHAAARTLFARNQISAALGGDHSVSIPIARAAFEHHPDLHVLHLDAHCDLRAEYGGAAISHACVARRILDFIPPERYFGAGMRSGTAEEFAYAAQLPHHHPYDLQGLEEMLAAVPSVAPLYVTLDLDLLDPAYLPGTGTPEPLGLSPRVLHAAFMQLRGRRIVGFDIVELAPHYDPGFTSATTAAFFTRELLLIAGEAIHP